VPQFEFRHFPSFLDGVIPSLAAFPAERGIWRTPSVRSSPARSFGSLVKAWGPPDNTSEGKIQLGRCEPCFCLLTNIPFCHTQGAMKGNPKVLTELNKALREELTAINQYFLHAEMCENWGYHKLSEFIKKQSIGEMKHAEVLIERILFLDGSPSMQPLQLTVGGTVKAMIEGDLALEVGAVKQYNDAVAIATKEGDNGSRDLLVQLLKDEEEHVDFLEAQLHQIKELGYERYLSMQMGEDEEE
jgi:bacterioferritin